MTDYTALHPSQIHEAADYDPARRKTLDKPSTMDDVIDFVLDFMNSDVSCMPFHLSCYQYFCRMWV